MNKNIYIRGWILCMALALLPSVSWGQTNQSCELLFITSVARFEGPWPEALDPLSDETAGAYSSQEEFLKFSKIKKVKRMTWHDGASENKSLVLFSNGQKAIFKPFEKGAVSEDQFDIHQSEVICYRMSQYVGLNLIPTTVEREIKGQKGSLQLYLEPEELSSRPLIHGLTIELFEFLVAKMDPCDDNMLFQDDRRGDEGRPVALIDFAQSLWADQMLSKPEKRESNINDYVDVLVEHFENPQIQKLMKVIQTTAFDQFAQAQLQHYSYPEGSYKELIERKSILVEAYQRAAQKRSKEVPAKP